MTPAVTGLEAYCSRRDSASEEEMAYGQALNLAQFRTFRQE